ncbi:MAG: 3-hydroxyacyl-CoA dehydrogenase [Patulibacter sp.]|nr:3-hydroxyacyl-CoA dehydrogenase [Patulibacter sp.]
MSGDATLDGRDGAGGPIVVVGGGTMGAGIALLAALHAQVASVVEGDGAAAAAARDRVARALDQRVARGRTEADAAAAALGRIRIGVGHDPDRDAGAVAVIEAVPERLELKHDVLTRAGRALPTATLASNTSSIPIREIAAGVPQPERVVGLHFFNPPTEMRLVELIVPPTAATEHVEVARRVAVALGRTAIEVADAPGFVVNRCARPYYLEALRILDGGEATVADVDRACQAAGFPLGPFALMDLIGVDVGLAVTRSMWERGGHEPRWRPSPIQERMVAEGRLGRKAGRGFYDYETSRPARPPRPDDREAAARSAAERAATAIDDRLAGRPVDPEAGVLARILAQLVNEARFARAEGVAASEAIDDGMTLGLNHPVGPSRWQEWIGPARVDALLDRLAGPDGDAVYRRPAPDPGDGRGARA